jgi:hypothetical protein
MFDYAMARLVKHLGFDLTLNDNWFELLQWLILKFGFDFILNIHGFKQCIGASVYHPPFDSCVGRLIWFE